LERLLATGCTTSEKRTSEKRPPTCATHRSRRKRRVRGLTIHGVCPLILRQCIRAAMAPSYSSTAFAAQDGPPGPWPSVLAEAASLASP
jgi:hypothetical protein